MSKTFCERFDQIASRRAGCTAIEFNGRIQWSYRKLQDRSIAIARAIKSAGIKRQSIVAIALHKSPQSIASLIGIWRSGCAALPIAAELPPQRQESMMDRADAAAVITTAPRWSNNCQIDPIRCRSGEFKCPPAASNDLAYVFFTSGSTGRPKAVAVEHMGLMPMLDAQIAAFEMDHFTRSLFYLSTAFDASLSDIGTALISGGTLVIDSDLTSLTVEDLMTRIDDRRITFADLPPALMTRAAELRLRAPESLRTVVVGGEVCPEGTQKWWASKVRLVNAYGPTEGTVCTSLNVCDPTGSNTTSIGQPIASMTYRIEPCQSTRPLVGELWISGPGIARGYLDDDTLTRQRFVMHQGRRWYRTGDRVQLNEHGEYLFRGRIDRQFKILGKLVEPAEIEWQLLVRPEIAEATVVPMTASRENNGNDPPRPTSIAAMVRPIPGCQLDLPAINESLSKSLPDWMVPQHFRIVDQIPRTNSGKPDLRNIEKMFATPAAEKSDPPHHVHGRKLKSIFQQSLRLRHIDWDDDFFLIGGDSLATLQAIAQAESAGIGLTLAQLRRGRTLRNCLDSMRDNNTESDVMSTASLQRHVDRLIDALPQHPLRRVNQPHTKRILMTGATGLLGTWVLEELRSQSAGEIVCLVRARDPAHGLARINASRRRFLWNDAGVLDQHQVTVACGDLSRDRWGLQPSEWVHLADTITDIFHLAADVHLMKSFEQLRLVNFDAVAWAIRMAATGASKSLHYASTLSVFAGTDLADDRFFESDNLNRHAMVFGGYSQTKWAGERLLRCYQGDFPLGIYRFGLLTGDSQDGLGASSDQLAIFTRGLARIGMVPAGYEQLRFDVTPVNEAATAMCTLAENNEAGTFHLGGKRSVSLCQWVDAMRSIGIEILEVSLAEFQHAVGKAMTDDRGGPTALALMSFCRRFSHCEGNDRHREFDLFLSTDARFDTTLSDARLCRLNIPPSEIDDEGLTRLVTAIVSSQADRT